MRFIHYFYLSEQPSASLGVLVDKDISVRAAGIYTIIQMQEEDIDRIEEILKNADPISNLIDRNLSPEEIMKNCLANLIEI